MKLKDYSNALIREPNNLELKKEYHRRCYELFDSAVGDMKKLQEIAVKEGITAQTIRNNAKEYYEKCIENFDKSNNWKEKYIIHKSSINTLYLELINENNKEKIIELIQKYDNLNLYNIRDRVVDFVIVYFPECKDYLIDSLQEKISIYIDYRKELNQNNRQEQKNLQEESFYLENKNIIENFIIGNYDDREQYCQYYNIDIKTFNKLIDLAKNYDEEIYKQYKEIIENTKRKRYASIIVTIKRLVDYLENGIKDDNNKTREFDIIDYYLLIKLDFQTMSNTIKNADFKPNELKLLRIFISKNQKNIKDSSNDIHQILNPNNKQIIGNRIIELQEKEFILNFLKKNKIPKNNGTYNIALRRYLKNTLPINELNKTL